MSKEGKLIQVFRTPLTEGNCYKKADYTKTEGSVLTDNETYWTAAEPIYVGKYIKKLEDGQRGTQSYYLTYVFSDDENKNKVTVGGTTSFIPVDCKNCSKEQPGGCLVQGGRRRNKKTKRKKRKIKRRKKTHKKKRKRRKSRRKKSRSRKR